MLYGELCGTNGGGESKVEVLFGISFIWLLQCGIAAVADGVWWWGTFEVDDEIVDNNADAVNDVSNELLPPVIGVVGDEFELFVDVFSILSSLLISGIFFTKSFRKSKRLSDRIHCFICDGDKVFAFFAFVISIALVNNDSTNNSKVRGKHY